MNGLRCLAALCFGFGFTPLAQAYGYPPYEAPPPPPYSEMPRFVIGMAYSQGGYDFASVHYDYGDSDRLEAGSGLALNLGFEFPLSGSNLALRVTGGYQYDSVHASNGKASFEKTPCDVLMLLDAGRHRFGAGLTYHTGVHYYFRDDAGTRIDADFQDASGWVATYEYLLTPQMAMGLRYTNIEYELEKDSALHHDGPIDGSNVGINLNFLF